MEFSKYLSLYCEAKDAAPNIDQDIKDYIDDRLNDVDTEGNVSGARYNVIPSFQEGRLMVIDIDTGGVIGNIDPKGKLISVPVVYGDSVSFAVQDESGKVQGTVRALPDGNVINQFRVGQPKEGMKFKEVMGREEIPPIEPEQEPVEDDESTSDTIEKASEDLAKARDELNEVKIEYADAEEQYNAVKDSVRAADKTMATRLRSHMQDMEDDIDKKEQLIQDLENEIERRVKGSDIVAADRAAAAEKQSGITAPPEYNPFGKDVPKGAEKFTKPSGAAPSFTLDDDDVPLKYHI